MCNTFTYKKVLFNNRYITSVRQLAPYVEQIKRTHVHLVVLLGHFNPLCELLLSLLQVLLFNTLPAQLWAISYCN